MHGAILSLSRCSYHGCLSRARFKKCAGKIEMRGMDNACKEFSLARSDWMNLTHENKHIRRASPRNIFCIHEASLAE